MNNKAQLAKARVHSCHKSTGRYLKGQMFRDLKILTAYCEQLEGEVSLLRDRNSKLEENLKRFAFMPETVGEV